LTENPEAGEIRKSSTGHWLQDWLTQAAPGLRKNPAAQCVALVIVTTLVFLLFPGLDVWFSGLFYDPDNGFPMTRLGAFIGLRAIGNGLTWLIAVGLVITLLVKLALPWRPSPVAPRDVLFILSTLAIGPGLIVNLVLKDHWGRPRPWRVDLFGGDQPFVGVWRITDYCTSNCSFVSGEASSAIWLLTALVLVPPHWRPSMIRVLLVLIALLSLDRIGMGGHFLSDVVLAWWIALAVIAVAYRLLYLDPLPALAPDRLEDAMTRAGNAIRSLVVRSPAA
jgi:lipid A 4'-phosphatase